MAELYLGATRGDDGSVELAALKRLLPHLSWDHEFVRMFLEEVHIVAGLKHPNIVRVLDFGTGDGGHYLALEYVHGETLLRVLKELGDDEPALDFALGVVAECARGLDYAHEYQSPNASVVGLVHRDVSPSNVMVSHKGEVKLLDFGIARISGRTQYTKNGMLKGKVGYMAPEQCRGEPVDRRTDVFGLGILLYELSLGRRAFVGGNEFAVVGRILAGEYVRPREVNPDFPEVLENVIVKALSVDPATRHETAGALADDIERVAKELDLELDAGRRRALMVRLFDEVPWPEVAPSDLVPSDGGSKRRRTIAYVALVLLVALGSFFAGAVFGG
jgi:serine/threonine-protein kinase